ncbi:hypothetical protein GCM10028793_56850 [Nocardiopsis oceani]
MLSGTELLFQGLLDLDGLRTGAFETAEHEPVESAGGQDERGQADDDGGEEDSAGAPCYASAQPGDERRPGWFGSFGARWRTRGGCGGHGVSWVRVAPGQVHRSLTCSPEI